MNASKASTTTVTRWSARWMAAGVIAVTWAAQHGCSAAAPSCDAFCANALAQCNSNVDDCVKSCGGWRKSAPKHCGSQADAVLACLETAGDLDCSTTGGSSGGGSYYTSLAGTRESSCAMMDAALTACLIGGAAGTTSGGTSSDAAVPPSGGTNSGGPVSDAGRYGGSTSGSTTSGGGSTSGRPAFDSGTTTSGGSSSGGTSSGGPPPPASDASTTTSSGGSSSGGSTLGIGAHCQFNYQCTSSLCTSNVFCGKNCTTMADCANSSLPTPNVCVAVTGGGSECRPGCITQTNCDAFASAKPLYCKLAPDYVSYYCGFTPPVAGDAGGGGH